MKTFRIIFSLLIVFFLFVNINSSFAQKKDKADKKYISWSIDKDNKSDLIWSLSNVDGDRSWTISLNNSKSSNLRLNKTFNSETVTKKSEFIVEKGQSRLKVNISGTVGEGKITITVTLPNKEIFKEVVIDPAANINWSQSIRFSSFVGAEDIEEIANDDKKYVGTWEIEIKAENAKGQYSFDISAE